MFARLLVIGALTSIAAAQNTTTTTNMISASTTMSLFLGIGGSGGGFVGSVVNADSCGTTYGIVCTAGGGIANGVVEPFCNASSTLYATYAPGRYESSTSFSISGGVETDIQVCSLTGSTGAVCSLTGVDVVNGKTSSTTTITTLSSQQISYWQIPITAGASKLASPAPCTSTQSATGGAAAATGISEVYKVLIVPGAAALLAGALV